MSFVIEPRPYADADVARLVAEVQQEYVERYGGPDGAVVDAAEFAPPRGLFLLGLLDGVPVAMGGWRRFVVAGSATDALYGSHDVERDVVSYADAAEIKRMYVAAAARRRGLARVVLAELERTAEAAGLARLLLNTGPAQPEAIELYEAAGYRPVDGFGHYRKYPNAVFLGKGLVVPAISGE